jgi:hypothetical protein
MNVTYDFISDPGHGWLKVPMMDLIGSGITNEISCFSYYTQSHAYLEEDCDAPTFIKAVEQQGKQVKFNEVEIQDFDTYLTRLGRVVRFTGR